MKKMFKINEDKFSKAVNIAHSYFWLADCPNVETRVRQYIKKTNTKPKTIAEYVAIICSESVKREKDL